MNPITPQAAKRRAIENAKDGRVDLEFRQFILCYLTTDDVTMSLSDRKDSLTSALEDGDFELTDKVSAYLKG